jgi:hypothetical protein
MKVTRANSNNNWIKNAPRNGVSNNGVSNNNWIKNAPTIVGQNFKPWLKKVINTNNSLISKITNRTRIGGKNNISAVVKSARTRAALELYSKYKGYYINAHGACVANSPKFTIPKDKAVLFVAKAGEFILNNKGGNLERTLLLNNGRIQSFIQGSTSILNKLQYGDYKGRVYLPGEDIYEHYIHFTRDSGWTGMRGPPNSNINLNNENLRKLKNATFPSLGPSFGHIWKLPLPRGYNGRRPFVFSNNKNRIVWNLPALLSRSPNARNNAERYMMRRQLQKLSTILRQGPPGVYIIGTCRQDIFINKNSQIKNYAEELSRGIQERGMSVTSQPSQKLNQATRYFSNVKKQNITNASRVPQISNTAALRSLPY